MLRIRSLVSSTSLILITAMTLSAKPKIGQSAITTYVFPWGARSLGMGETFTGVANSAEALFYNPAGLGQSPLATSWLHMMNKESKPVNIISISAKPNRSLADKEFVWALSDNGDILKYNGSTWVPYTIHLIDSSETIREISEKYLDLKKYEDVEASQNSLLRYNEIGSKSKMSIRELLKDGGVSSDKIDSLADLLTFLPVDQKNETDILGHIFEYSDSKTNSQLASKILVIADKPSGFKEMLELKVPFNLGIGKGATSLFVDHSGRLWATTNGNGLWKFDGSWKQYTSQDGLGSDTILSVTSPNENSLLIGTSKGLTEYSNGLFKTVDKSFKESVSAATQKIDGTKFVATAKGLFKSSASSAFIPVVISDLSITGNITTLYTDTKDRLWVGSHENIAIFDGKKWSKYQFKGSKINSITESKGGTYWIATDKGAVEMIERNGQSPEWKVYHAKNGLPSSEIHQAISFGKDIWLATGNGVSQYKSGELQVTGFFEQLLPSLGIDDIWHAATAGVIPLGEFGTIGVQANYLYFGEVPNYDVTGVLNEDTKASFEFVGGLSYGLSVKPNFSLGLSLKYAFSRLSEDSKATSVAVDAGILKTNLFVKDLSLGFALLNMGPAVDYGEQGSKDPIPFSVRLGTSYTPIKTPAVELLVAVDLDREIVFVEKDGKPAPFYAAIGKDLFNDPDETVSDEFKKILVHTGLEFTYAQLITARLGYMHDEAGSRQEMNFGMGVKASVVQADFGMIFTLGENDIRNNQVRFSITYAR